MRALLALAFAFVSTAAFAHIGVGDTAGFMHGFEHPIGGIDHVLAMIAVGVFAYVLGGRARLLVPLSFVGMMVVGFLLGASGVDVPFVELGIALSSVVIGGAIALGRPMPTAAASALVAVFAIFHGHAHGAEMPADAAGFEYALGFVAATALLHATGILAALGGARAFGKFGKLLAQIAGSAFALGGLGVLSGWL
ncbi:MAG: HupE/UreJ family protein [Devosia sp.]